MCLKGKYSTFKKPTTENSVASDSPSADDLSESLGLEVEELDPFQEANSKEVDKDQKAQHPYTLLPANPPYDINPEILQRLGRKQKLWYNNRRRQPRKNGLRDFLQKIKKSTPPGEEELHKLLDYEIYRFTSPNYAKLEACKEERRNTRKQIKLLKKSNRDKYDEILSDLEIKNLDSRGKPTKRLILRKLLKEGTYNNEKGKDFVKLGRSTIDKLSEGFPLNKTAASSKLLLFLSAEYFTVVNDIPTFKQRKLQTRIRAPG